ncbi:MerR family transcriptional regulator [Microbacterium sp. W4I20]|uniref:MerR family transcriptional regulator n=1 Tax=Microbacterium sp. W4I20 TaxID=3042262 RepID=UPI002786A174|nr:MerR family transcriptional regulator [Microbacterium sp. W4I20]MDQ0727669.1 DNA-binding transcriptional MerR regulator [Microbacterium sp. W4I20]
MYSIGEFAAFGRVSPRMLRHYDAIDLLKPAQIDDGSGYRSYGVWQLPDLYLIAELRELGVGLPEIDRVLAAPDRDVVLRAVLAARQAELAETVRGDRARLERIGIRLTRGGEHPMSHFIDYTALEELAVYATRGLAEGGGPEAIGATISELIPLLDDALGGAGRPLIEPGIFWYVPVEGADDVEVHISYTAESDPVPGRGYEVVRLPAVETMARLRHHGDMSGIGESWAGLMTGVVADGYELTGPSREVYVHAPGHEPGDDWITELQVPVRLVEES